MYVSSYTTYIHNDTKPKLQNRGLPEGTLSFAKTLQSDNGKEFSLPLRNTTLFNKLPLNYVSAYKALNNQLKLQNQIRSSEYGITAQKSKTQQSARQAYTENQEMIANIRKPKVALQTFPTLNTKLPISSIKAQEQLAKTKMINTYISNENYYRAIAS